MPRPQLKVLQEAFYQALRREKNDLSLMISPIGNLSESACIDIYANGYSARLVEALGETFEATWWTLGDDTFFALSKEYVSKNVSHSYDLSDYGDRFPEFLEQKIADHEIDFVADLARFEWSFKDIFHKPNLVPTPDLLSRLQQDGSDSLRLSSSAKLFESPFSVYEIWKRRGQAAEAMAGIDWKKSDHLLLYRHQSKVFVHSFDAPEFLLVRELAAEKPIADSLSIASNGICLSPEQVQATFAQIGSLGVFSVKERRPLPQNGSAP